MLGILISFSFFAFIHRNDTRFCPPYSKKETQSVARFTQMCQKVCCGADEKEADTNEMKWMCWRDKAVYFLPLFPLVVSPFFNESLR